MKNCILIFLLYLLASITVFGQSFNTVGTPVSSVDLISSVKIDEELIIGGDMGTFVTLDTQGQIHILEKVDADDELSRYSMIQSMSEKGFAVGTGGSLFKFGEGTWNKQDFGYKSSLRSVYAIDDNKVIITATEGKFFLSEDGGTSWTEKQISFPYDINCAIATESGILLCGSNGLIILSDDFFETLSASINNVHGNILAINRPDMEQDKYLLFSQEGQIFQFNLPDTSFSMVYQNPDFTFTDLAQHGDTILATASEQSVLISTDRGINWEKIDHNMGIFLYSVEYYNDQFILSGKEGHIVSYGNNAFEKISPLIQYDFHCATTFNNKIFTGTYDGKVLATTDGGVSWVEKISVPDEIITGIVSNDENTLLFSTSEGSIYSYENGTESFMEFDPGITANGYQGLHFTGGNYYVVTLSGDIYKSSNAEDWQINYQNPDSTVIFDILIDEDSGLGFAVGDRGKILKTSDNGVNWNEIQPFVNFPIMSVIFSKNRWMLAGMYGTFVYSSDGMDWKSDLSSSPEGESYTSISANPEDEFLMATSINGNVMLSEDNASSWDTLASAFSLMTSIVWTDNNTAYAFGHNSQIYSFNFESVSSGNPVKGDGFLIYPVPASEKLIVQVLDGRIHVKQFKITDIQGKLIHSENLSNRIQYEVNVTDLKSGVYFITLETSNKTYTQRFVVR